MASSKTRQASATEGVPQEWQEDRLTVAYARWFPYMEGSAARSIALLIEAAEIQPGFEVLDVSCGAGVPALRLAEVVGPEGRVVATDPSAVFIAAVTENARQRGLTNVEAVQASAAGLPFAPESFDATTCHFGAMFFADVQAGLTRIREVLRPGRRAAFVAWGPVEDNLLFGPFREATAPYLPEPAEPPDPDAPNPMRFAEPGSLSAALRAAGYQDVREEQPMVEMVWPGPPQRLTESLLDISNIEENVPPDRREAMRADVVRAYGQFAKGDKTHLSARIVIASGASG